MSGDDYQTLMKVLLIGDSAVGKSSLLLRFCDRLFNTTYITTIGVDFKIRTMELEHEGHQRNVKIQIWDSAGQEKFRTICQTYYRGSHGIMMVYDVTNRESFESIEMWLREINIHAGNDVVKLLIGTKIDKENRAVTTEEGKALADKMGIKFVETSALSGANVEQAFTELAGEILKSQSAQQTNRPEMLIQATIKDEVGKKPSGCCK